MPTSHVAVQSRFPTGKFHPCRTPARTVLPSRQNVRVTATITCHGCYVRCSGTQAVVAMNVLNHPKKNLMFESLLRNMLATTTLRCQPHMNGFGSFDHIGVLSISLSNYHVLFILKYHGIRPTGRGFEPNQGSYIPRRYLFN